MREFSFADANSYMSCDAKLGKYPAVWKIDDLRQAMTAHAYQFDLVQTLAVLKELTGLDAGRGVVLHMPRRYYGPLIARYCAEIVGDRPFLKKVNA
jgi:hypothetical protein